MRPVTERASLAYTGSFTENRPWIIPFDAVDSGPPAARRSETDIEDPMHADELTEAASPICVAPSTLANLPNLVPLATDSELPTNAFEELELWPEVAQDPRTEAELPYSTVPRTERVCPRRHVSDTEQLDPALTKPALEVASPSLHTDETEQAFPA